MAIKRGTRSDYTPSVRPRTAREDGRRRLTPGYLEDLSDTKHRYVLLSTSTTSRETVVTPDNGFALRLIRLKIVQESSDGLHFFEVYFGTGANLGTNPGKSIDFLSVPDLGEATTRTWSRGAGPVGEKDEVLSLRATAGAVTQHRVLVEYTQERVR